MELNYNKEMLAFVLESALVKYFKGDILNWIRIIKATTCMSPLVCQALFQG